ncbi:MAG: hypothetical protein ACFFB3_07715 [Candidatus Hodarchaeota archaeon]
MTDNEGCLFIMFMDKDAFIYKLKSTVTGKDFSVALAADNDLDGLTAACVMDMALYEVFDIEVDTCFRHELTWEIDWQQLPEAEYQVGIFLDLAYGNTPNYRNAAAKVKHSFAIDHHVASETGFPQKVLAYNPCRNAECYLPTAYLAGEVAQGLGLASSPVVEYLVALGVLADSGIYFNLKPENELEYGCAPKLELLYEKSKSKFPALFKTVTYDEYKYPQYRSYLAAIEKEAAELGWNELYVQWVNESESLENLQNLIDQIYEKHPEEFEQLLAELPSDPTETSSSGVWILKNVTAIPNGALARTIAEMTSTPIVVYKCAKMCFIAARAPQGSLINFIPAFETYGGGHEGACGAVIPSKDLESFLDNIRTL